MGVKNDIPDAPDPYATAAAQTQANKDATAYNTVANRYNTFTPYGSQTWQQYGIDPVTGAGLYNQYIDLSPTAQATVDQNITNARDLSKVQNEFLQNARSTLANPIDLSKVPEYQYNANTGNYDTQTQQAQDAVYNKQKALLDPQYQQAETALQTRLANQGINLGSAAYDRALDDFSRQRDFAYGNARNDAITAGYGVQNQLFNQGLANNQNYNNNVNQQLNKLFALNNQPLQQYNALASGTQVQTPTFQATPVTQTNPVDIAGLINTNYNQQLNSANADAGGFNSLLGGIGSIAGTVANLGLPGGGTFGGLLGQKLLGSW
jgi:hypothetical protein